MNQTEGLQAIFEALIASEWPLVAERAVVTVGYAQREFSVSPLGCRVEIRFGQQAFGSPNLMDIVREAGAAAEQLLCGAATKPRHASRLVGLHHAGAPLTNGNQQLTKLLQSRDRARVAALRNWLADQEGIPCSARKEGDQWIVRVESQHAAAARASLRLFNAEWQGVAR